MIRSNVINWADDRDATMEEYKLGRAVERAIVQELEEIEHGENILPLEEEESLGILYIEDGIETSIYHCDSCGP